MNNTVPEGWEYKQLGDYIIDSAAGEWGNEAQGDGNDIPVLRSTNFTKSGVIDYTKLAFRNIEERKRIKKALNNGDILLEKSGGSPTQPVGRVVYFDRDTPYLYSNFTQKLVPAESCHNKYLFYKLYFEYQNGTVLKFQQQTTGIINFQLAEYLGFKTTFAPLPEQQKIATILTSVDDVIEKTRAQIDKLKDLKTGMMQELLTKGIGSDGVPHTEFKDSPVGRIPASWTILPLEELCTKVSVGIASSTTHAYASDGVPLLRNQNILPDAIRRTGILYISEKFSEENASKKIRTGDVLTVRTGYPGVSAVVPPEFDGCHSFTTLISRPKKNLLNPFYLSLLINSDYGKHFVVGGQAGGAQQNLNATTLKTFPVILPTLQEQTAIYNLINSISLKIKLVQQTHSSLIFTRKALMQDLLTGKVRTLTEGYA